ncbi:MAG: DUF983 domain-containing protein [Tunicatimonas sp.]
MSKKKGSPPSKLYSILALKCPRCRQGDLFTHKPYQLSKFLKMPEECDCCHLRFEREPGFFYGAMYVSYAFQVAIVISVFVALQVLYPEADTWVYVVGVTGLILLLFPLIIRLSRSIWIYFFISYDKRYANTTRSEP